MKRLTLVLILLFALPALASTFFPLGSGLVWTLQREGATGVWTYGMGTPHLWHEEWCHPRVEWLENGQGGTTYWSEDPQGRILLHGLVYQNPTAMEFYFVPPAVYLDATMLPSETITSLVNVYEVLPTGDAWHGEYTVNLHCLGREPVTTDLGTFPAITVDPSWTDSPSAPWTYADDGALAFGCGIGPVRVQSLHDPEMEWRLIGLQGLDLTAAPETVPTVSLSAAPNPFNPATTLRFELGTGGQARLDVFDLAGRRVATVCDEVLPAGSHATTWQPRDLASGLYLARLVTPSGTATFRLVLLE